MRSLDGRLLRSARPARVALAAAVLLGVLTAGLAIAQAAVLADAISSAFLRGATDAAISNDLVLLAALLVARACAGWASESVAQRCSAGVKSSLRRLVLAAALSPGSQQPETRRGDVVTLVTRGLDALDPYFARYLPQVALSLIVPLAVVVAAGTVDLVAAATIALTIPLMVVFMVLIGMATGRRSRRRWLALTQLSRHFLDVVAGLPTLKVFGRSRAQLRALDETTDAYRHESLATLRLAFLSSFALELGATLSVALVAVGVGLRLVAGDLDLRTGLFVLVLAPEAYLPLRQLSQHYHASEQGRAAARAAFEIVDAAPQVARGGLQPPDVSRGGLSIEALSMVHADREVAAPSGAGLTVRGGEIVAITGPSGAGKSTLLTCVAGLVTPTDGRITVFDAGGAAVPLGAIDREAWWRAIAWVPQSPFLFAGSVAENVRFGDDSATDAEVSAVLARVGLAGIAPGARLEEGGLGVSSGERRRVAMARALLRRAAVLLLDEPTAGLDGVAEAAVLAAIREEADRGAAVLLVAHRPAAIAVADRVVPVRAAALAEKRAA